MSIRRDALIIAWVLGAAYILSPNQPRIKPMTEGRVVGDNPTTHQQPNHRKGKHPETRR